MGTVTSVTSVTRVTSVTSLSASRQDCGQLTRHSGKSNINDPSCVRGYLALVQRCLVANALQLRRRRQHHVTSQHSDPAAAQKNTSALGFNGR
jgi:hypothetical protein